MAIGSTQLPDMLSGFLKIVDNRLDLVANESRSLYGASAASFPSRMSNIHDVLSTVASDLVAVGDRGGLSPQAGVVTRKIGEQLAQWDAHMLAGQRMANGLKIVAPHTSQTVIGEQIGIMRSALGDVVSGATERHLENVTLPMLDSLVVPPALDPRRSRGGVFAAAAASAAVGAGVTGWAVSR